MIFENCYLQDEHKVRLCEICGELQVDWVKTSTGFGTGGATVEDVRLMRDHSPAHVQVKAAGGIRSLDMALSCVRQVPPASAVVGRQKFWRSAGDGKRGGKAHWKFDGRLKENVAAIQNTLRTAAFRRGKLHSRFCRLT